MNGMRKKGKVKEGTRKKGKQPRNPKTGWTR